MPGSTPQNLMPSKGSVSRPAYGYQHRPTDEAVARGLCQLAFHKRVRGQGRSGVALEHGELHLGGLFGAVIAR
jgi:hypothetical protein